MFSVQSYSDFYRESCSKEHRIRELMNQFESEFSVTSIFSDFFTGSESPNSEISRLQLILGVRK